MKRLFKTLTLGLAVTVCAVGGANAGTIENLERERALLIGTLLAIDLGVDERQEKAAVAKHRLVDLERMVLRDKSLAGNPSPTVRAAFANYDLTFLVHASVEKDAALVDHWLSQVGITTQSLMQARVGRR